MLNQRKETPLQISYMYLIMSIDRSGYSKCIQKEEKIEIHVTQMISNIYNFTAYNEQFKEYCKYNL